MKRVPDSDGKVFWVGQVSCCLGVGGAHSFLETNGFIAEPVQTITAILLGPNWDCLLVVSRAAGCLECSFEGAWRRLQ